MDLHFRSVASNLLIFSQFEDQARLFAAITEIFLMTVLVFTSFSYVVMPGLLDGAD